MSRLPFDIPGLQYRVLYDEANLMLWCRAINIIGRNVKHIKPEELSEEKVLLLLNSGHCFSNQVTQACPELIAQRARCLQGNSLRNHS